MRDHALRAACAVAVSVTLVLGCTLPPVLTPQRIADRGLAPLARTAEVRLSPTVYFEQRRLVTDEGASELTFELNDIAVRPNFFAAFAFTDTLAMVFPLGVLWSPVVQVDRGFWLTAGGGVYGFSFGGGDVQLNDAAGVWAKRRFGSHCWLLGGVAAWHWYDSSAREEGRAPRDNAVWLIPGVEAGLQVMDAWAVALLADYRHDLIDGEARISRLRIEHIFVPVWWIDIGVHGGVYLHAREELHADPLVGFTVTGRW